MSVFWNRRYLKQFTKRNTLYNLNVYQCYILACNYYVLCVVVLGAIRWYIVCACILVCVEEKCESRCQYVCNFRSDFLDFLLPNGKQKVHAEFYFSSSMFQKKWKQTDRKSKMLVQNFFTFHDLFVEENYQQSWT